MTLFPVNLLQKNYSFLKGEVSFIPLKAGLINDTWLIELTDSTKYILQRVNPIFPPEVNIDIAHLTDYLKVNNINTISILPTDNQKYWLKTPQGIFRILSWCPGRTANKKDLKTAAVHLANFHDALADFSYKFRQHRDIHNTSKYLQLKSQVLARNKHHRAFSKAKDLIEQITENLLQKGVVNEQQHICGIVHGDPKPDNFLITDSGPVLIDLDTVGYHSYFGEIGDFMRSWCRKDNSFDRKAAADFFYSYLERAPKAIEPELPILHLSCETIALELSLRFALDILEESYFKWDRDVFDYAWQHNLQRAKKEYDFARSVIKGRDYLKELVSSRIGIKYI